MPILPVKGHAASLERPSGFELDSDDVPTRRGGTHAAKVSGRLVRCGLPPAREQIFPRERDPSAGCQTSSYLTWSSHQVWAARVGLSAAANSGLPSSFAGRFVQGCVRVPRWWPQTLVIVVRLCVWVALEATVRMTLTHTNPRPEWTSRFLSTARTTLDIVTLVVWTGLRRASYLIGS